MSVNRSMTSMSASPSAEANQSVPVAPAEVSSTTSPVRPATAATSATAWKRWPLGSGSTRTVAVTPASRLDGLDDHLQRAVLRTFLEVLQHRVVTLEKVAPHCRLESGAL